MLLLYLARCLGGAPQCPVGFLLWRYVDVVVTCGTVVSFPWPASLYVESLLPVGMAVWKLPIANSYLPSSFPFLTSLHTPLHHLLPCLRLFVYSFPLCLIEYIWLEVLSVCEGLSLFPHFSIWISIFEVRGDSREVVSFICINWTLADFVMFAAGKFVYFYM
jgi:hypothetical protein